MNIRQEFLKAMRHLVGIFFPQPPRLFLTPDSIILVLEKEGTQSSQSFESMDVAITHLKKIKKPFEVYIEGFDQTLVMEPLPSLTFFERRSYVRHKIESLLEKASFTFVAHHKTVGTFVTENWIPPQGVQTDELEIKAVHSFALEVAKIFTSPTLLRLAVESGKERLFYCSDRILYFTRTIQQQDQEAYEKTLRYIERRFYQPAQNLDITQWTIDDLIAFLQREKSYSFSFLRGKVAVKARYSVTRPYYIWLGLKSLSVFLGGVFLFLSVDFYQDWQTKEVLQSRLFALKKELKSEEEKGSSRKPFSELSDRDLDHFEKLLQRQKHPLKDFKFLAPLNTETSFLKGLIWTAKKGGNKASPAQITLQLCSRHKSAEELETWATEVLRATVPFLDIHCHGSPQSRDLLEDESSKKGEKCVVVDIVKRGPPQ